MLETKSFTKRREEFTQSHPCGIDDSKVPNYYKKLIKNLILKKVYLLITLLLL